MSRAYKMSADEAAYHAYMIRISNQKPKGKNLQLCFAGEPLSDSGSVHRGARKPACGQSLCSFSDSRWVKTSKRVTCDACLKRGAFASTYKVVTRCAVPGWADKRQRVFEPDGNERKATVERFAKSLGLKKSQYKIVEVSHG